MSTSIRSKNFIVHFDKGGDKHSSGKDLSIYDFELLPNYIKNNKDLFNNWIVE